MGARKDAMLRGETTYETGRPCMNGHTAYRYVLSGSCSACIAANRKASTQPTVTPPPEPDAPLVVYKARIFHQDVRLVFDTALALVRARWPAATLWDVVRSGRGRYPVSDSFVYGLHLDERDVPMVRDMVRALFERRCADGAAVREQIFGKAVTSVPVTNLGSLYEDELSLMHRC